MMKKKLIWISTLSQSSSNQAKQETTKWKPTSATYAERNILDMGITPSPFVMGDAVMIVM